jgi:hypothetical protein
MGWVSTLGDIGNKEIKHMKYENGKEKLDYVEKYKIDFVSKNFQDTIQNDNLPSGPFYETWLAKKVHRPPSTDRSLQSTVYHLLSLNNNSYQLPDDNHLMVNGYANSWIIDPKEICSSNIQPQTSNISPLASNSKSLTSNFCTINPDGSYDFEMLVEFWPQRLFYIGLFISGLTLLGCLSYLGYTYIRTKKKSSIRDSFEMKRLADS